MIKAVQAERFSSDARPPAAEGGGSVFYPGPSLLEREPAVVVGAVTAVIDAGLVLLFAFVGITAEQQGAALAFAAAATALIGALVTRGKVTPVAVEGPRVAVAGAAGGTADRAPTA